MNRATVFFIAFFTALLTAAGTSYLVPKLLKLSEGPQQVVIPSMLGLTETDARANLQALGLVLMVGGREPHPEAQPSTVIRQAMPAGQRVPPGQAISVTLAIAMPKVPDVAGQTIDEATRALETAGFAVQVGAPQPHAEIEKGRVVSQSPKAGTALEAKSTVVVQPSAGPESVEVPKLVGTRWAAAKKSIEEAGLKVGPVQWVDLAETPTYLVLRQNPAPGEQAEPGTAISMTVNSGE
jgi:serine/threonine-protein kinase